MNEEKFTGKSEVYDKFRPSYPDSLIDRLYETTNAKNVADIGAGTGIFTKCLARRFSDITAVEPNPDMYTKLRENVPFARTVNAAAEDTGLSENSFGLVTAAQAFHWFDSTKFKAECERILTKDGSLAVIWNTPGKSAFRSERDRIFKKYCGMSNSARISSCKETDCGVFLKNVYFSDVECFNTDNPMLMDEERFIGYSLSHSYSLKGNEPEFDSFVSELREAFYKFSKNGVVEMPQYTECFLGKF